MRLGRISTSDMHRHRPPRRSHRSRTPRIRLRLTIIKLASRHTRRRGPFLLHPPQPIGVLLDRKGFTSVLLDAAVAFPDTTAFARIFQVRAKVRCAVFAEGFLEDVELFAVATGDLNFDGDWAVDVADRAADAAFEAGAALEWC